MVIDKNASAEARGERLRYMRDKILRYSRKEFAKKYKIPPGTMQNWESARNGGLSESGAKKLLEIFAVEGIHCPLEWLMYGIGTDPFAATRSLHVVNETPGSYVIPQEMAIAQELQLFHQHTRNAVDTIIADDSMAPIFVSGDLVAGQRYFGKDITKALNLPCIVHTETGEIYVRIIKATDHKDLFNLVCSNTLATQPILKNIKIFSVAPVLWLRRKTILAGS
jgi:transcriptional regulator with XRE-family HTH domain